MGYRNAGSEEYLEAIYQLGELGQEATTSRLAEWLLERTHEMGLAECLKAEFERSRGRDTALSTMLASAWSCLSASKDDLASRVKMVLESTSTRARATRMAIMEFLAPASLGENYNPGMFYEFQAQSRRFAVLLEGKGTTGSIRCKGTMEVIEDMAFKKEVSEVIPWHSHYWDSYKDPEFVLIRLYIRELILFDPGTKERTKFDNLDI